MCGGTAHPGPGWVVRNGLSPRVRGNPLDFRQRAFLGRSIPACAGEPVACHLRFGQQEVYPRVCGGTRARCRQILTAMGLSPRVRGNR